MDKEFTIMGVCVLVVGVIATCAVMATGVFNPDIPREFLSWLAGALTCGGLSILVNTLVD